MASFSISSAISAPQNVLNLLDQLHKKSLAQEQGLYGPDGIFTPIKKLMQTDPEQAKLQTDALMKDKFIALEADKASLVYTLIRTSGSLNVVEAGTSFGVSTIYLALAVAQNAKAAGKAPGAAKVIATEYEASKVAQARSYWKEAGDEVEPWIELREGDLRETLKTDLPVVDFVLLDIWTPMVLPTLKALEPRFRPGTILIADNVVSSAEGYREYFDYIRASNGKYKTMTLPYSGGLEITSYWP